VIGSPETRVGLYTVSRQYSPASLFTSGALRDGAVLLLAYANHLVVCCQRALVGQWPDGPARPPALLGQPHHSVLDVSSV